MEDALTTAKPVRRKNVAQGIPLELDLNVRRRLKHVAKLQQTPYRKLLEQFVVERLYEEGKSFCIL